MRRPSAIAAPLAALGLALAALLGGCRDRDPNIPIALVGTPGGLGGSAVPVNFVLRNDDTQNISVDVQLLQDGEFRTATRASGGEALSNIQASPGGTAHIFLWDALTDLGPGRHTNVILRFIPRGTDGHQGTIADTFPFVADNTDLFIRAPDLAIARDHAGAAALPEGGVLVSGGGGLSGISEAFDPATNTPGPRDAQVAAREAAPMAVALVDDGAGAFEAQPAIVAGIGAGGVTLTSVERYDSGADRWIDAGLDVGGRVGHTVTRLRDGRLLVAGGGPASDVVVDLRDPSAPASATIPSGADRAEHAAALLPDGRVLISGGRRAGAALSDTLVFSPLTLSYTAGPSLVHARYDHASALAGLHVLVAGGHDALGGATSSAEIADVTLTAFEATVTSMTSPREGLAAIGLADGTVLLTGGADASGRSLATAEKFFQPLGLFSQTRGPMTARRRGHQATAYGAGRALISGGGTSVLDVYIPQGVSGVLAFDPLIGASHGRAEHEVTPLSDGRALITGGTSGVVDGGVLEALASAELFDPRVDSGRQLTPAGATLTAARRRHTATLLQNGQVLVAGGLGASGAALASLELFDPTARTFTALPEALPAGLSEHTATRLNDGRVLIAGGLTAGGNTSAAALLFDPSQPAGARLTTATATLAGARRRHTATLLGNGQVLLAGGVDGSGAALASAELFDPAGPTFTATAGDLGLARFGHAAVRLSSGTVLVSGGRGGSEAAPGTPTADVRRFDIANATFTALAPMTRPRAEHAAVALVSERAVFAGGVIGLPPLGAPDIAAPVTAGAEVYSASGAGSTAPTADPDLSAPRRGIRAVSLNDGTGLLIGGRREDAVIVPGGERLFP